MGTSIFEAQAGGQRERASSVGNENLARSSRLHDPLRFVESHASYIHMDYFDLPDMNAGPHLQIGIFGYSPHLLSA